MSYRDCDRGRYRAGGGGRNVRGSGRYDGGGGRYNGGGSGGGEGGRRYEQRQEQNIDASTWPDLQGSSSRGANVPGGRGRGHQSEQRQEPNFDSSTWPDLKASSSLGASATTAWRGWGNAGGGNTRETSGDQNETTPPSAQSDVVSAIPKEIGTKVQAADVASSSRTESASDLSEELAENLQITQLNPPPPLSSKAMLPPSRPGVGQLGKKIWIRANHFLVDAKDRDLHHYDVTITPEVKSKKVNREVMEALVKAYKVSHLENRNPAYDGMKNLYTAGPLSFESHTFHVDLEPKRADGASSSSSSSRREKIFKVHIKFASSRPDSFRLQQFIQGKIRDAPYDTVQVLDIVLRDLPSQIHVPIGRSFFNRDFGTRVPLGNGLENYNGYFQSIRLTQMGLSLNIDVSARPFYETITIPAFIIKFLDINYLDGPLTAFQHSKVKNALKNLKVELTHFKNKRISKITGISDRPINQLRFTLENNEETSIVDYFRDKYKYTVRNKHLPAIQTGNDSKPTYYPMELCRIAPNQRYAKKLTEKQVSELLNVTCRRPEVREKNIKNVLTIKDSFENELVEEFGIKVDKEPAAFQARILPAPRLIYHETGLLKMVDPKLGKWDMKDKKLVHGGDVTSWTCVNFSKRIKEYIPEEFCTQLIGTCKNRGMRFVEKPIIPIIVSPKKSIRDTLYDIHRDKPDLQLLIVILPDATGSYGLIKKICETELGIVSQCCQPQHVEKQKKPYMDNVTLKINVKTGGRNNFLDIATKKDIPQLNGTPAIIFGADVTHPQPGEDSSPSIAAVVASMDWPEITKYQGLISAQAHREEIIQDLYKSVIDSHGNTIHSGLIIEHIIAFKKANKGRRPEKIIFFRDGVSEGQFSQVLLHEVEAIRKACWYHDHGHQPLITFVVVQKRHHTRLFPSQPKNLNMADGRSGNLLPGTVVDTDICHPTEFDFYLNSHVGIQGTSRPAHYHVLYDENNFSADQLQTLTNNLCYTFARCTRAVSIVPPAYYAHLTAFRARYYMENNENLGDPTRNLGATVIPELPEIKDNVKEVMFYC